MEWALRGPVVPRPGMHMHMTCRCLRASYPAPSIDLRRYAYPVRPNCGPAVARRTCQHSPSGVDGLGAALDHDDPTVAKLAHADGEGEAAGPTADYHHIGFGIGGAHLGSVHYVVVAIQDPETQPVFSKVQT